MSDPKPIRPKRGGFVEQRIQEAMARGEFNNLRGAGRPLPDLGGSYDPRWWVKSWLRREGFGEMADNLDAATGALAHEPAREAARDRVTALERLRRRLWFK